MWVPGCAHGRLASRFADIYADKQRQHAPPLQRQRLKYLQGDRRGERGCARVLAASPAGAVRGDREWSAAAPPTVARCAALGSGGRSQSPRDQVAAAANRGTGRGARAHALDEVQRDVQRHGRGRLGSPALRGSPATTAPGAPPTEEEMSSPRVPAGLASRNRPASHSGYSTSARDSSSRRGPVEPPTPVVARDFPVAQRREFPVPLPRHLPPASSTPPPRSAGLSRARAPRRPPRRRRASLELECRAACA